MRIIDAERENAPIIADAVMDALGEELCLQIAGEGCGLEDVHAVFTELAGREDSQYSWLNSRVAVDEEGRRYGVAVSYDGARLKELRRSFFRKAVEVFGWKITPEEVDALPGETADDEFYLDSLAVLPEARGKGVGAALIADARERAAAIGKPLGLLVDDDNPNARRLYEYLGFRKVGRRNFAGVMMDHMQI